MSPPHVSSGGPVLTSPGFPLKACGNDGLRKGNKFYAASCGELDPVEIKIFLAKRTDKKYVDGVSFARNGMVIAASPEIAE